MALSHSYPVWFIFNLLLLHINHYHFIGEINLLITQCSCEYRIGLHLCLYLPVFSSTLLLDVLKNEALSPLGAFAKSNRSYCQEVFPVIHFKFPPSPFHSITPGLYFLFFSNNSFLFCVFILYMYLQ